MLMDGENILTIDQLVGAFPAFSEKTIRWWIYNGKRNGFEACLIRIGASRCGASTGLFKMCDYYLPIQGARLHIVRATLRC